MIRIKFVNETDYHTVSFTRVSEHLVTLRGSAQMLNTLNTSGFYTYKQSSDVLLGDFTAYTTVYRVFEDCVQYSDDGSVWEAPPEPVRDVTLCAKWDDVNNIDGVRPERVRIIVNEVDEVVLTAEHDWCTTFTSVPFSKDVTITSAEAVEGYTVTLCGQAVVYYHEYVDPFPSLEERVTDAEDAIIELYDLVLSAME